MKSDGVKSETDISSFSSTKKNNNSRTQIQKLTLIFSITALVIFGFFIGVPSTRLAVAIRAVSNYAVPFRPAEQLRVKTDCKFF